MTIGPEPITRTRLMSVRLGMYRGQLPASSFQLPAGGWWLLRPSVHAFDELLEQVIGVVRPGRRFRMVLHAEHRFRLVTQTLDGAVVQIDVRDGDIRWQRLRVDREAVILRGDLDLARFQLLHRVVCAPMTELQLVGLAAQRQRKDLMPETDAECRHVGADELLRVTDRVRQRRGIAGAVTQENAV